MKAVKNLEMLCNAVSALTTVINIVDDYRRKLEVETTPLSSRDWLGIAYAADGVRDLYNELPDLAKDKETTKSMEGFFPHMFKVGDTDEFDLQGFRTLAYSVHTLCHTKLSEVRDFLSIYK